MPDWLDRLHQAVLGAPTRGKRKWLHRNFHLSGSVMHWLDDPDRTTAERCAFAELLLRLDANPVDDSAPVLQASAPPGMRWASFGAYKVIFILDAGQNSIHVLSCV